MKVLLNIDGISFYTTTSAIRRGVGESESVNTAARQVYKELMDYRRAERQLLGKTVGCGGDGYSGHHAQISIKTGTRYAS